VKEDPGQLSGNAAWYQQQAALHHSGVAIYGVPVQTRELFGVLHLKGYVFGDLVFYSGASLNSICTSLPNTADRYLLIENRALADSMTDFMREHLLASSAVHRLDQPEYRPPAISVVKSAPSAPA
jgi:CDP-diacylglycerol--serine O-phosphatidyltransferase